MPAGRPSCATSAGGHCACIASGGYRSAVRAEPGAIFATILTTARKRGRNAYERLCASAGPSPLHVAEMIT